MRLFECQRCGQLLDFENTWCLRCGLTLGYLPGRGVLSALEEGPPGSWRPLAAPEEQWRFCANSAYGACNWLLPASDPAEFCAACRLNRTIPNLVDSRQVLLWQRIEFAKHRLIDGLISLGLPLESWAERAGGLGFDFLLPEDVFEGGEPVVSGHRGWISTLDLNEADDAWREASRAGLGEPYRTLLGHLRHESGHYYWSRLIDGSAVHARFRELFGDETQDYDASLHRNYIEGSASDWNDQFISAYASAHPWEDWAETWAHYLHMLDTLDTAYWFGLSLSPRQGRDPELAVMQNLDPYGPIGLDPLIGRWLPLVYAGNRLSRSMGQPDLYPFVLNPVVIEKFRFVHEVVRGARSSYRSV
jgi:hypothetical protein